MAAVKFFTTFNSDDSFWVNLLKNKLEFNFKSTPKRYYEKNNKSALENIVELRAIMNDWEKDDKIRSVSEKQANV